MEGGVERAEREQVRTVQCAEHALATRVEQKRMDDVS